jgi:hypothetical protein
MEQVQGLGLTALDKFCRTLGNWLDKIANYFRSQGSRILSGEEIRQIGREGRSRLS